MQFVEIKVVHYNDTILFKSRVYIHLTLGVLIKNNFYL